MESSVPSEGTPAVAPRAAAPFRALRIPLRAASPTIGLAVIAIGVAVAYTVVAWTTLHVILHPPHVSGMWPAAGIGLAALLVTERRHWPLILAIVALAASATNLVAGIPITQAAWFVAANTLEPLLAVLMLGRVGFRPTFDTLRSVGWFFVIALGASAVAGVLGAAAPALLAGAEFLPVWVSWTLADAGGIVTVTPVIVVLAHLRLRQTSIARVAEALALGTAIVGVTAISFLPIDLAVHPMAYPVFLLLVVVGVRFGATGAALATLAVAGLVMAGTLAGYGPIAALNENVAIGVGQAHIMVGVAFLTSFVTAATMTERRVAAEALEARIRAETNRAATSDRVTAFAREITQALESEALFQRIVKAAVDVVPADIAQLTIEAEESGGHRIVAAIGAPAVIGRIIEPGDGVTGAVIRDGVAHVHGQVELAQRASVTRDVVPTSPVAIACAPVVMQDAVRATIGLARFDLDAPFGADDERALQMMADLVAVALTNSMEFGRTRDLSIRDELTGVPNRRYFSSSFEQLSAQRLRQPPEGRQPVSAVMFDLDHFGAVNKERGHPTGDRVLAEFGRILANRLRRADVVARYGGEEFVALLVGTSQEDAFRVADEIRESFETSRILGADGEPIRCTVSAGVATVPAGEASLDGLIPAADVALSMAKRAGRNLVAAA